jgi:hypothetical protein
MCGTPPHATWRSTVAKAKAKKTTKNRIGQEVKPMDQDPMRVTLQKCGTEVVKSMIKLDRLEEKDPAAFRKELDKWMRENNRVKSAR